MHHALLVSSGSEELLAAARSEHRHDRLHVLSPLPREDEDGVWRVDDLSLIHI